MAEKYDFGTIEPKWQKYWEEQGLFKTAEVPGKKKKYVLDMFPYPSGSGLHVGHPKGYIATDIYSRYWRMKDYDVLHPMGWDAFGLPAENYAIENQVHPREAVEKNIERFKSQLVKIGFDYDWDREINTTDPEYYKWTQWIFLQLFKAGLAYESHEPINWCPSCQTGLANEDLEDGKCERCGSDVEQRPVRQWVLKITDYADKLLEGLEELDWPEQIKEMQRNWIGRSEGAVIQFPIPNSQFPIDVFTTRADTLYGATYVVLAPEHPVVGELFSVASNKDEVEAYIEQARKKTLLQRQEEEKEKTGVQLKGVAAVNPASGEELPVYIADYVLMGYGTGAIMAVPAHDERDFEFAKKFGLPVKQVIDAVAGDVVLPYTGDGVLINSKEMDGMSSGEAKRRIAEKTGGELKTMYRLRDWVFSRQRYWGEPIPIIHCDKCGAVAVPDEELPVVLPEVENYKPTGTGESPLAVIDEWVNTKCPKCGGEGKRETNTMPQWAGSSWYYLRYIDPTFKSALVDSEKEKGWMPVDMYVGGAEHATRHLIYARFWHRFLYEQGVVSTQEPFLQLQNVGLIMGEDGRKMSKRWGNVVNPDDVVARYGADTLRVYEMFMGPFNYAAAWSTASMVGASRFLRRVWEIDALGTEEVEDEDLNIKLQKTIVRVTQGIEKFSFNTAIAALMEMLNEMEKREGVSRMVLESYVRILSPFAPHIAEEIWERLGHNESVLKSGWPEADEELLNKAMVTVPVQVNGKVRGALSLEPGRGQEEVEESAKEIENVRRYLEGKDIRKVVYVSDRLINFVINE